jgi:hypothetical protein
MGKGKNPIKEAGRLITDAATTPFRETSRAAGADGIVDAIDGSTEALGNYQSGLVDKTSGKDKRMKKDAAEAAASAQAAANADADSKAKQAAAAEANRLDQERMNSGASKSRTLLTGGTGLEDDEEMSISRKTLIGM